MAARADKNVRNQRFQRGPFPPRSGVPAENGGISRSGVSLAPGGATSAIPQVANLSEVQTCA